MKKNAISRKMFLESTGSVAAVSCCMLCGHAMAADSAGEKGRPVTASGLKASYFSACGIYCGACPPLMKGEKEKDPAKIQCLGCFSDKLNPQEAKCEVLKCAMEKKIKVCSLCKDYPCEKTDKHLAKDNVWVRAKKENLGLVKGKGLDKWLDEQKARWTCQKCGQ